MNGNDVFNHLLESYRTCCKYEDSGSLASSVGNVHFKTYFCRPDIFKFEWTIGPSHAVPKSLTYDGKSGARLNLDDTEEEHIENLSIAIGGLAGITWGAAPLIAHLLLPNLFQASEYKSLKSLGTYERIDKQDFDDNCYRIRAKEFSTGHTILAIDKTNFALRSIEKEVIPLLEDKKRALSQLRLQNAPIAEIVALESMPQTSITFITHYTHLKLD